jgi:hypothetical protein
VKRFLATPFGLATLACLVLAGWALWSGGILDGTVAREVRSSSVYAAPGTGLDTAAAERVIGNRRLVVVLLPPGADLRGTCKDIKGATQGTVALLLSRDGDDWERYGCSSLPAGDGKNFGRAFVAETRISTGVDQFVDRPLEAVKVAAVNYDRLVKAGTVPDGARTISPSLPRYLIALAAVAAVVLGSAAVWLTGRRAARAALRRQERRDAATDDRTALSAATGVLAQQLIELDGRMPKAGDTLRRHRHLTAEYTQLLTRVADADRTGADLDDITSHAEVLGRRARSLAAEIGLSGKDHRA